MSKENSCLKEIVAGTIATVLGGIILALIPVTRNYISGLFSIIGKLFQALWNFLFSEINLPWIAIIALFLLAIPTVARIVRKFIPKSKTKSEVYEPRVQDYVEDEFFGVIWRWNSSGTVAYCPNCQTRLVYNLSYDRSNTSLYCETCAKTITTLDGERADVLGKVARQIERKINTEAWKKVVEHKRKSEN